MISAESYLYVTATKNRDAYCVIRNQKRAMNLLPTQEIWTRFRVSRFSSRGHASRRCGTLLYRTPLAAGSLDRLYLVPVAPATHCRESDGD